MFENLDFGALLSGADGGFDMDTGKFNPLALLAQLQSNPAAMDAFLNRAAMGADPSILTGAMPPTGISGETVAQSMTPPPAATPPVPPHVAGATNQQSPYFEFGVSPDVQAQITNDLPSSQQYAEATGQATPQPSLGALLAGAGAAMPKREQPKPETPPRVAGGSPSSGSVNRTTAPNYLPTQVGDPQAAQRRATLAMLLGGR